MRTGIYAAIAACLISPPACGARIPISEIRSFEVGWGVPAERGPREARVTVHGRLVGIEDGRLVEMVLDSPGMIVPADFDEECSAFVAGWYSSGNMATPMGEPLGCLLAATALVAIQVRRAAVERAPG